jgi:hypothetical protein
MPDVTVPNVTVVVQEGKVIASCTCGWAHTVHTADPAAEGTARIMTLVEAHLEAHRRER